MAEATPVVLGLIKELRSHEVAIAELNHLSSSRVTLSTPLSFTLYYNTIPLLILCFISEFNLSLSSADLSFIVSTDIEYVCQVLVKITHRVNHNKPFQYSLEFTV